MKPWKAAVLSYTVLALFHGLHFGFFFAFISLLLVQVCSLLVHHHVQRKSLLYPLYSMTCLFLTEIAINYCIPPMVAQTMTNIFAIYSRTYFIGHFILIVVCVTLFFHARIHFLKQRLVGIAHSFVKRIRSNKLL